MPKLTREQIIQHLTPPAGIRMAPYPAWRDRIYRGALLSIGVTMLMVALGQAIRNPEYVAAAHGLTAISVAVAAVFFLVWLARWRYAVWGLAIAGLLATPFQETAAWACTLAAGSVMAAKETHCFHFLAGRIIPGWSVATGLVWLVVPQSWIMAAFWAVLGTLWIWLALARFSLPVFDIPGHQ